MAAYSQTEIRLSCVSFMVGMVSSLWSHVQEVSFCLVFSLKLWCPLRHNEVCALYYTAICTCMCMLNICLQRTYEASVCYIHITLRSHSQTFSVWRTTFCTAVDTLHMPPCHVAAPPHQPTVGSKLITEAHKNQLCLCMINQRTTSLWLKANDYISLIPRLHPAPPSFLSIAVRKSGRVTQCLASCKVSSVVLRGLKNVGDPRHWTVCFSAEYCGSPKLTSVKKNSVQERHSP